MFNSTYSIALDVLLWRLAQARITLRAQTPDGAFWAAPCATSSTYVDALDVTFVDDETMVIATMRGYSDPSGRWTMTYLTDGA